MEKMDFGNQKRCMSIKEAVDYIGLGKSRGREFLRSIGAEVRIGGRCLYDVSVIDDWFDSQRGMMSNERE